MTLKLVPPPRPWQEKLPGPQMATVVTVFCDGCQGDVLKVCDSCGLCSGCCECD